MQVTVGSLATAAAYLSVAIVHYRRGAWTLGTFPALKNQYIDMAVNIRNRIDTDLLDNYVGLYITEVSPVQDITLDSSLWGLARKVR